jgi:2-succinyl-5-enolpyruvyl-6-hydroxy-3-cyclohexene-1-carboxylate synthase
MTTNVQQATHAYVGAFVDELVRCGVYNVCICPGSRSTPLAMMFADNPKIKVWMHIDERSAAFFALGVAKSINEPVVLVCTSGTAAANFLPAIVEAHYSRIPLLVLTADRPPELREIGAPQTIDQNRLYGVHVKNYLDVALPDATTEALRYIRSVADRSVAQSLQQPMGAIHLNFPFREPLVPLPSELRIDVTRHSSQPYTVTIPASRRIGLPEIKALAAEVVKAERGLIVCGSFRHPEFGETITRVSEMLGYPILADPLSQVRTGHHDLTHVIAGYDAFLRDIAIAERLQPEIVLRFGGTPTSKPLTQYLQRYSETRQIVFDGGGDWKDPSLLMSQLVHADSLLVCEELIDQLGGFRRNRDADWLTQWTNIELTTQDTVANTIAGFDKVFEGRVFAELSQLLPENATLYVSSSMPVRDMDTFFVPVERAIRIFANRGANGIDGVVSSALGASVKASGPTVLVIGDLAFYHDMNGLLAAKLHKLNMTVVLINNDGGGIFSFLPQAAYPEHFERLYGTPHGLDFSAAAALYDAKYSLVDNWAGFREALTGSFAAQGLQIVEVRTDRQWNVEMHRAIWKAVSETLASNSES